MFKISRKLSNILSIILIVLMLVVIGLFVISMYTDMDFLYVQIVNYILMALSIIRIFLKENNENV